jgi:peptidyl-tRNA hydrolase
LGITSHFVLHDFTREEAAALENVFTHVVKELEEIIHS